VAAESLAAAGGESRSNGFIHCLGRPRLRSTHCCYHLDNKNYRPGPSMCCARLFLTLPAALH